VLLGGAALHYQNCSFNALQLSSGGSVALKAYTHLEQVQCHPTTHDPKPDEAVGRTKEAHKQKTIQWLAACEVVA
jgi:hypothetical protein